MGAVGLRDIGGAVAREESGPASQDSERVALLPFPRRSCATTTTAFKTILTHKMDGARPRAAQRHGPCNITPDVLLHHLNVPAVAPYEMSPTRRRRPRNHTAAKREGRNDVLVHDTTTQYMFDGVGRPNAAYCRTGPGDRPCRLLRPCSSMVAPQSSTRSLQERGHRAVERTSVTSQAQSSDRRKRQGTPRDHLLSTSPATLALFSTHQQVTLQGSRTPDSIKFSYVSVAAL